MTALGQDRDRREVVETSPASTTSRLPGIGTILAVAAFFRLVAAFAVQYVAQRRGTICLFGDTPIYCQYGRAIATGADYVVHQWDVPHYALRTPGYPIWLAANMALFGDSALAVRIAQALLGVCMVWWVYRLGKCVGCSERSARWSAAIAAIDPFQVGLCVLILSESLFTPLLVLLILRMVSILKNTAIETPRPNAWAGFFAIGALQSFLGLVRPAWQVFLPVVAVAPWFGQSRFETRKTMLAVTSLCIGWAFVTMPWVVRNIQRIDRPAVTGTWGGATLYDSVRPGATGASEMSFVADPRFRDLAETEQDDLWKRLSLEAIRSDPGRMASLAIEKQRRFWSPWPNDSAKLPLAARALSAAVVIPVWLAILAGWFVNRRKAWVWLVLSPLILTAATHLAFVGSSRYRMAVIMPAMVLAGEGVEWFSGRFRRSEKPIDSSKVQESAL